MVILLLIDKRVSFCQFLHTYAIPDVDISTIGQQNLNNTRAIVADWPQQRRGVRLSPQRRHSVISETYTTRANGNRDDGTRNSIQNDDENDVMCPDGNVQSRPHGCDLSLSRGHPHIHIHMYIHTSVCVLTLAPCSRRSLTTRAWFSRHARMSAVYLN